MNPLIELDLAGQSPWLDFIDRDLLRSGMLERLIREDGIRGVTSNPAIFEKAIAGPAYTREIVRLAAVGESAPGIYEALAIDDIRAAADALAGVYGESRRRDGYVSLEVAPSFAHDRGATIAEAQRLWRRVGRANLMIKIPGTTAGIAATEDLVFQGLNINVTLLFSLAAYDAAAEAYLRGLERRHAEGLAIDRIGSVASFFVSRIDSAVDKRIDAILAADAATAHPGLASLRGQAAIANARLAFGRFEARTASPRWRRLLPYGAMPQRLLWASTGAKNPAYRDVVYVEELIGPDTVNTLPLPTLEAFRDHGRVRASLVEASGAQEIIAALRTAGIDFAALTDALLVEGLQLFETSFKRLIDTIAAAGAARKA